MSGDLRLLRGPYTSSSYTSGLLQIYLNGQWGTVCDDLWNLTNSDVACRQLGFSHATRPTSFLASSDARWAYLKCLCTRESLYYVTVCTGIPGFDELNMKIISCLVSNQNSLSEIYSFFLQVWIWLWTNLAGQCHVYWQWTKPHFLFKRWNWITWLQTFWGCCTLLWKDKYVCH